MYFKIEIYVDDPFCYGLRRAVEFTQQFILNNYSKFGHAILDINCF